MGEEFARSEKLGLAPKVLVVQGLAPKVLVVQPLDPPYRTIG